MSIVKIKGPFLTFPPRDVMTTSTENQHKFVQAYIFTVPNSLGFFTFANQGASTLVRSIFLVKSPKLAKKIIKKGKLKICSLEIKGYSSIG